MQLDFTKIIPLRYHDVSYDDVLEETKKEFTEQIRKRNGVYIYGEAGVGKTHLACAFAKHLLESGIEVMFYNSGDFLEKLREEFQKTDTEDDYFFSLFREVMDFKGVLVFDDLGAEKMSDWARERLYLIINKKYEDLVPIIFTSNVDLEIISARLGDRVASRIKQMAKEMHQTGEDKRLKLGPNMKNQNATQRS